VEGSCRLPAVLNFFFVFDVPPNACEETAQDQVAGRVAAKIRLDTVAAFIGELVELR